MSKTLERFLSTEATLVDQWRAIVLFGKNSASYKFALAAALLELGPRDDNRISLEELAFPFAKQVCRHLEGAPRQALSSSSRFLSACNAYRENGDEKALREATVQLGFANVIDAFHNLGSASIQPSFFVDERQAHGGIRLTDDFHALFGLQSAQSLSQEVESRWNLVETAWDLGLALPLIEHEDQAGRLVVNYRSRRIDVTSSRDALNGYQKGRCFYCSTCISIQAKDPTLAHVDHFLPVSLASLMQVNLNGVWNLVLSCQGCNASKSDAVPMKDLVYRLLHRNEYLISSQHPLRETLISQTGLSESERASTIGKHWAAALQTRCASWAPREDGGPFL